MKKCYVYELYNQVGTIEYVGESVNPKNRWYQHICKSKDKKNGKFFGRDDIKMRIVKEFDNKKDAYDYQCKLQKEYGLFTDSEKMTMPNIGNKHSNETLIKKSIAMKESWNRRRLKQMA